MCLCGTPIGQQMRQLDYGVNVAVWAPGSLIDLIFLAIWRRVTPVEILHYTNSNGKSNRSLTPGTQYEFNKTLSVIQAISIYLFLDFCIKSARIMKLKP